METFAIRTLQRNDQMTSPKSSSTMFLKSRAGRANLETKFPKPLAWFSVMISALQRRIEETAIIQHRLSRHEDKRSISLYCRHTTTPASDVATQYDAKALKEGWEELVDGHVGRRSRGPHGIMGYVLSMDQHKLAGILHGDGKTGSGGDCGISEPLGRDNCLKALLKDKAWGKVGKYIV